MNCWFAPHLVGDSLPRPSGVSIHCALAFSPPGEDAFGSARRQIPVHRQDHLLPMHGIAVTGAHNLECEFLGLSLLSTAEDPVPLAPAYLVAAGSEQRQPTILVARTRPPKPAR